MTQAGVILGTAAYMSPEQARGKPVDKRADIWAFGAVLYEMLTGRRAFGGDDVSEVLASVLAREPDWTILPAACSPVLVTYLKRCLNKDRRQRIRDIGDVSLALAGAFETPRHDALPRAVAPPVWRQALPVAMTALVAVLVTGLAAWGLWPRAAPSSLSRFEAPVPENVTPYDDVSVSPDGRKLVFAATAQDGLWLRDFDALEWRRLPGTEGASTPFWSPDSRHVGFTVDDKVRIVDTTGGPPETVASLPEHRARVRHLESEWRHRVGELGRRIGRSAVESVPGRWRGQGGDAGRRIQGRVLSHVAHVPPRRQTLSVLPLRTAGR